MKKGILVVSFGTSHLDTMEKTIQVLEDDAAETFPEYRVYRAFTSRMILRKLEREEGIKIDTVEQALERGDISVTTLELDGGAVVNAAFDVGGLNGLRDLVYYTDGETHTTQNVNLVLLFNGTMAQSDLRFESLSFLSYLIEHYSE